MNDEEAMLATTDRMIDLELALRALIAVLDAEAELDDARFSAIWPALANARRMLDPEAQS